VILDQISWFKKNSNPRIGLIALATDFMIEKDFINVIKDKEIDFFVNRIECFNPLTKENLIKMSDKVTEVTNNILPDENIDCIVYGCTSGTIAAGYNSIEKKVKAAKPKAKLTTPSTAAIKALKKFVNLKKSKNEIKERLEQLRAIDNNMKIDVLLANYFSSGIDTKKDLEEYINLLNK